MKKSLLNKWLDKLQQESWQLELLISGFAILGLFNLKGFITSEMEVFYANINTEMTFQLTYGVLVVILLVTRIFIINLLIHIMIRGLWIGAIGLRYVSGDIDYTKLKYNQRFLRYYKRTVGSFDNYIVKLEKLASIIFSFTFLLFFVFISFFLFVVVTAFLSYFLKKLGFEKTDNFVDIVNIIWLLLFALVAFDFITLGLIRKIKQRHFAKFYLGLYKVVGIITLSFLWRPLLLNFLDQKFTKRLLIAVVPYIVIVSLVLPNSGVNEYEYFPQIYSTPMNGQLSLSKNTINANSFNTQFYDSMREESNGDYQIIQNISLPSNKIKGNIFEVFLKYTTYNDRYIEYKDSNLLKIKEVGYHNTSFNAGDNSVLTKEEKNKKTIEFLEEIGDIDEKRKKSIKDSLKLEYRKGDEKAYSENIIQIKKYAKEEISFFIDEQPIPDSLISLDFYIHPNAGEKGMLSFFPIDLTLGRHSFTYHKLYLKSNSSQLDTLKVTIPFIYLGE